MTNVAQLPPTAAKTELFRRAENLLRMFKDMKETEKLIEADKAWFRGEAKGETLTEKVPGLGIVQVKKPSEASTKTVTTTSFSVDKFNALDDETRKKLILAGVVSISSGTVSTPAGTAAVTITPNV